MKRNSAYFDFTTAKLVRIVDGVDQHLVGFGKRCRAGFLFSLLFIV